MGEELTGPFRRRCHSGLPLFSSSARSWPSALAAKIMPPAGPRRPDDNPTRAMGNFHTILPVLASIASMPWSGATGAGPAPAPRHRNSLPFSYVTGALWAKPWAETYSRTKRPFLASYVGAWKLVPPTAGNTVTPFGVAMVAGSMIGRPLASKPLFQLVRTNGLAQRNWPLVPSSA